MMESWNGGMYWRDAVFAGRGDWGEVWEAWYEEGGCKAGFGFEQEPAEGTEGEMVIGCEGKKRRWGKEDEGEAGLRVTAQDLVVVVP